jgi:DNA-directed RNA polymerase specialized sigma24 family protein
MDGNRGEHFGMVSHFSEIGIDPDNLPDQKSAKTDEKVSDSESLQKLKEVINILPEPKRDILMCRAGGDDYKELSYKLNIPVGTVKSRLRAAKKAAYRQLRDE